MHCRSDLDTPNYAEHDEKKFDPIWQNTENSTAIFLENTVESCSWRPLKKAGTPKCTPVASLHAL